MSTADKIQHKSPWRPGLRVEADPGLRKMDINYQEWDTAYRNWLKRRGLVDSDVSFRERSLRRMGR